MTNSNDIKSFITKIYNINIIPFVDTMYVIFHEALNVLHWERFSQ